MATSKEHPKQFKKKKKCQTNFQINSRKSFWQILKQISRRNCQKNPWKSVQINSAKKNVEKYWNFPRIYWRNFAKNSKKKCLRNFSRYSRNIFQQQCQKQSQMNCWKKPHRNFWRNYRRKLHAIAGFVVRILKELLTNSSEHFSMKISKKFEKRMPKRATEDVSKLLTDQFV